MIGDPGCGYCGPDDWDPLCPTHAPPPRWLPTILHRAWLRWRATKADPEQGQLTSHQHGDYKTRHVDHGWWLTPTTWGLGIDWNDERRRGPYTGEGGQVWLSVQVGPLSWSVSLHQPYIKPPRTYHEEVLTDSPLAYWPMDGPLTYQPGPLNVDES